MLQWYQAPRELAKQPDQRIKQKWSNLSICSSHKLNLNFSLHFMHNKIYYNVQNASMQEGHWDQCRMWAKSLILAETRQHAAQPHSHDQGGDLVSPSAPALAPWVYRSSHSSQCYLMLKCFSSSFGSLETMSIAALVSLIVGWDIVYKTVTSARLPPRCRHPTRQSLRVTVLRFWALFNSAQIRSKFKKNICGKDIISIIHIDFWSYRKIYILYDGEAAHT